MQVTIANAEEGVRLSATTCAILAAVPDPELRGKVEQALVLANRALVDLSKIHLPQDEFEERETVQKDDLHLDLAPYVLAGVASINRLLGFIGQTFPPPEVQEETSDDEFDLEFDLVDGPTGDGTGLTSTDESKRSMTLAEQVSDAAHAYGGMLRSRVMGLAGRLRFALSQEDGWPLLAEIDDHQHKLEKAVQGLVFGLIGVFAQNVRRDEVLPGYRSAVSEAVNLRTAITELGFHVGRFNEALSSATPETAVPLVVALSDRLNRFSGRPEYRTLRAEDKKAVIDFRRELFVMRHSREGLSMAKLRLSVEGFSKFLESMQAINHREVLVIHDRQRLEDSLALAQESASLLSAGDVPGARIKLAQVMDHVAAVVGRHPDLDGLLRSHRAQPTQDDGLAELAERLTFLVQSALSTL